MTDNNIEMLITVDFSNIYYVPVIKLFILEMSNGADQTELEPSDVYLSSQSRMTYVYNDLPPHKILLAVQ